MTQCNLALETSVDIDDVKGFVRCACGYESDWLDLTHDPEDYQPAINRTPIERIEAVAEELHGLDDQGLEEDNAFRQMARLLDGALEELREVYGVGVSEEDEDTVCGIHESPLFDSDTHPWRCWAIEDAGRCGQWTRPSESHPGQRELVFRWS